MANEKTVVPGIPVTSLSNITSTSAVNGMAFVIPYLKQGCKLVWQVVVTGTASAISVSLQLSIDNTNWVTVDTSTDAAGCYCILDDVIGKYVRLIQTSRTGGTSIKGDILLA